jgi:predicted nucleic acid-binding protein
VDHFYREVRRRRDSIYTSDYVLDETITLLFRRLPFVRAKESLQYIQQAIAEGYLRLEWIAPQRFEKAIELRYRFQDKARISFTDLTSMVVTSEREIEEILTEDDYFLHVEIGFRKVP